MKWVVLSSKLYRPFLTPTAAMSDLNLLEIGTWVKLIFKLPE